MVTTASGRPITMAITLAWKMSGLMDRVGIKNEELAHLLKSSPETIRRLRGKKTMPAITGDRVGEILGALRIAYASRNLSIEIQISDLIDEVKKQK